jgi:hypothetical protein
MSLEEAICLQQNVSLFFFSAHVFLLQTSVDSRKTAMSRNPRSPVQSLEPGFKVVKVTVNPGQSYKQTATHG